MIIYRLAAEAGQRGSPLQFGSIPSRAKDWLRRIGAGFGKISLFDSKDGAAEPFIHFQSPHSLQA